MVYAKPPFSGPEAVLAYLSRYTHRVAISNHRLIALDETGVTFRYKDYRRDGADRQRTMTLSPDEFIRRFLLHVLRRASIASATTACSPVPAAKPMSRVPGSCSLRQRRLRPRNRVAPEPRPPCPCCGGRMIVIEILACRPGARATIVIALHRNVSAVTRHDEPQPAAEAMGLRPSGRHALASITRSTTAIMTARSGCLPAASRHYAALAHPNHYQRPKVNRLAKPPHHPYSRTTILKSP